MTEKVVAIKVLKQGLVLRDAGPARDSEPRAANVAGYEVGLQELPIGSRTPMPSPKLNWMRGQCPDAC